MSNCWVQHVLQRAICSINLKYNRWPIEEISHYAAGETLAEHQQQIAMTQTSLWKMDLQRYQLANLMFNLRHSAKSFGAAQRLQYSIMALIVFSSSIIELCFTKNPWTDWLYASITDFWFEAVEKNK